MYHLRGLVDSAVKKSAILLKADVNYLIKGGFWITFGQVASSLLSLGLVIGFANLVPKETYGTYRYILSIVGLLGICTLTGMNNAVSREVAAGREGALRASVTYQLKWNVGMFAVFYALGAYYSLSGNAGLGLSFFILGIFVPATLALNTYGAYLDGKREFRRASVASITSSLVYVAGMMAVLFFKPEIIWLTVGYAITTFATTFYFYTATVKKFHLQQTKDTETIAYGRELTFINLVGPIASQIDKIILAHFWGATSLAVYSLAQAVPDRATAIIKDWVGIGLAKFANKTPAEINTVFYRRILQGIALGVISAILYIALAPTLFKYALPQYLDSVGYSQVLSLAFLFAVPNRYVSLLLVSQKLSRPILFNNVAQSILKIGVYVILGLTGGIGGLVAANVANAGFGMVMNIMTWRRASRA